MAEPLLLLVETPFVRVEFRGPHNSVRVATLGLDLHVSPRLSVEAEPKSAAVSYRDSTGATKDWSRGTPGPHFFESTRYQVVAIAKTGELPPRISHRDPTLTRDMLSVAGQRLALCTLDFHEQVGLSELVFDVGAAKVRITIEVFPTKLDYATDYSQLLHEVGAEARGLAFEYLRSTYARVGTESAAEGSKLEWLALVRGHLARLEAAFRFIDLHPHRALTRTVETVRIDQAYRSDSALRSSIARGRGAGPWLSVAGLGQVRSRVPMGRVTETLVTPEHRWLKHNLSMIRDKLSSITDELRAEATVVAGSGRAPSLRLLSEHREVSEFRDRVERLLEIPFLRGIAAGATPDFASLALMTAPGYADAYVGILTLRLGLHVHGDALDLSTKELDVLYESWCFIRLARLLVEATGGQPRIDGMVSVDSSGIRVRLRRGQQSNIKVAAAGRELVLSYNRHFRGLTGAQKPDIVLEMRHEGWPEIIVVFDSKYRVDVSPAYLKTFLVPGPPIDAVNALHRYRDAIVLGAPDSPIGRPVVKGVALFPLPEGYAADFDKQPLFQSLDVLGIGALPFLPDSTDRVKSWLLQLLDLPPAKLAMPGPKWLAYSNIGSP